MRRGFILQSTYRIEAARPVVTIYGTLEAGGSFLIRDTRQIPAFYLHAADANGARRLGATVCELEPPWETLSGEPALRIEVPIPQDVPALREKLAAHGIGSFESDVPFASRYLSVVAYVITGDGPEPAGERKAPIDYEHYVQKLVRAVAEPVLSELGLNFDHIIGDDTQLRLF